jgi:hypothetical protein
MLRVKECTPTCLSSFVFTLGLAFESIKKFADVLLIPSLDFWTIVVTMFDIIVDMNVNDPLKTLATL